MLTLYTINIPQLFRALLQPPPELSLIQVDFQHAFCMTSRLSTLPFNYQSTEKPLFAALYRLKEITELQNSIKINDLVYSSARKIFNFSNYSFPVVFFSDIYD